MISVTLRARLEHFWITAIELFKNRRVFYIIVIVMGHDNKIGRDFFCNIRISWSSLKTISKKVDCFLALHDAQAKSIDGLRLWNNSHEQKLQGNDLILHGGEIYHQIHFEDVCFMGGRSFFD